MGSTSSQPIRDYKDLHVWQKGMELAKQVYLFTSHFPSEEKFGLVSQMRRRQFQFPRTLPKVKPGTPPENSFNSSRALKGQRPN